MGDAEEPAWCLGFPSFPLTPRLLNLDVGRSPLLLSHLPFHRTPPYLYRDIRAAAEILPASRSGAGRNLQLRSTLTFCNNWLQNAQVLLAAGDTSESIIDLKGLGVTVMAANT